MIKRPRADDDLHGQAEPTLKIFVGKFCEFCEMSEQSGLQGLVAVDRNRKPDDAAGPAIDVVAAVDAGRYSAACALISADT
jgi:hypothetical protein